VRGARAERRELGQPLPQSHPEEDCSSAIGITLRGFKTAVRVENGAFPGVNQSFETLHHLASWPLTALGHGGRLAAALEEQPDVPWTRAAIAYASGDSLTAADICASIGAATQEAYVRLTAARTFAEQGRRTEADAQLDRALAFYHSVRATHYVREAESLLAASA
jgi:hypothetical protein